MAYGDVKEQGATKRLKRPLPDFTRGGGKHFDQRVPHGERKRVRPARPKLPRPGDRDYVPRNPRSPKKWPGGLPPLPDGSPRRKPDIAPAPAGQNPSRPRPFAGPGARSARKVGRLLGRAFRWWDLVGILDDYAPPLTSGSGEMIPNPASGWRLRATCPATPTGGKTVWARNAYPTNANSDVTKWINEGAPVGVSCLSGQAITPNDNPQEFWRWMGYWYNYTDEPNGSPYARYAQIKVYWRNSSTSNLQQPAFVTDVKPTFGPSMLPQPNPNVMRDAPSLPTVEEEALAPEWVLGVGEGLGHPGAHDAAAAEMERVGVSVPVVPHENVIDITPQLPATPGEPPQPPRPQPPKPHGRRKAYGRRREIPKTKGSVYALFAALDALSEGAEVVDALFEALPEDVQARWERGRRTRPFVDTAGQYGIDGADWKMQAVWHNADKVDPVDFWRNLFANQTEDKLIGSLHRNLPRNFINANEDGQRAYAKLVRELLQALGLEDEEE